MSRKSILQILTKRIMQQCSNTKTPTEWDKIPVTTGPQKKKLLLQDVVRRGLPL